jgi:3-dehydrotetronate 4-kinase
MAVLMGCFADDFTGGTDLASMLVKSGMRTVQTVGLPEANLRFDDVDAVVIALKSRTAPVDEAVAESLAALGALRELGCQRFYFKYCSTFDSTPGGNICPVAESLMDELGVNFTIACPAFPANGRMVYKGYLFVGDALLSESSMRNHPLTPMTDSNPGAPAAAADAAASGVGGSEGAGYPPAVPGIGGRRRRSRSRRCHR